MHIQVSGGTDFVRASEFVDKIRELYRVYQKATSSAA